MIILRIVLISLIIFLLVRSFVRYFHGEEKRREVQEDKKSQDIKKISRDVGEYVDYEEIDKK